jgi:hypothetical protein
VNLRTVAFDLLVLLLIVAVPASAYLAGLGMYYDDWAFLASMKLSPDQSFTGLYAHLAQMPNLAPRPVQIVILILQYNWFSEHAFWGHVINHAVLWLGAGMLYVALRDLGVARFYALVLVVVYLCFPHFSTSRMWLANFQAHWSLLFFGVFLLATSRAALAETIGGSWIAQAVAALALALSTLAYEFFLPLGILVPVVVFFAHRRSNSHVLLRMLSTSLIVLLVAAALIAFKLSSVAGSMPSVADGWVVRVIRMYAGAAWASFGELGLLLPAAVASLAVRHDAQIGVLVAAGATFIVVLGGLALAGQSLPRDGGGAPPIKPVLIATLLALAVFVAGYAVLLQNFYVMFRPVTGPNNRVHIASALGVAGFVTIGVWIVSSRWRPRGFLLAVTSVAIICAAGVYVLTSVGTMWGEAFRRQEAAYVGMVEAAQTLPEGAGVMLFGVCPYYGPGPVLTSTWDLGARLQFKGDSIDIRADVITSKSTFGPEGITNSEFEADTTHAYGQLYVYDHRSRSITQLPDYPAARAFFELHPMSGGGACTFTDGAGERVL